MASNEYDRHVFPVGSDALLQIETIEVRQIDVEYQAAWSDNAWAGQKFLCGRERLRLPTLATDQRFQRFAYRNIVVDNKHYRRGMLHSDDLDSYPMKRSP